MNVRRGVHTLTYENRARSVRFTMSRRQCSVWGCSNRKGRCPEDVESRRPCKCPEFRGKDCPESSAMLSLHSIGKMPQKIYQIVVQKMNQTRVDQYGLSGSLDQKPTSVTSTMTDLKVLVGRLLSSYPPCSKDPMTSIPSQLKGHVHFWIVLGTVLMTLQHLNMLHLNLHLSNWKLRAWNIKVR